MDGVTENQPLKICVIGNSHVGSLKLGWDLMEQGYPQVQLTFFAAKANGLESLNIQNGLLTATDALVRESLIHTSGGHDGIDLSAFDICLIYGLKLTFPYQLEIGRAARFFSKAAYECALYDVVSTTLAMETLEKIRSLSDLPVYIGHHPLKVGNAESFLNPTISYSEIVSRVNRVFSAHRAVLLAQPEETITGNIFTKPEYGVGGIGIGPRGKICIHPNNAQGDLKHMNEIFGRIYLEHFFAQIPGLQH